MNWLTFSLVFWSVFWVVLYLVARQLDTDDYTRKQIDLPEESNHLYVQQEAYNRYENQSYTTF